MKGERVIGIEENPHPEGNTAPCVAAVYSAARLPPASYEYDVTPVAGSGAALQSIGVALSGLQAFISSPVVLYSNARIRPPTFFDILVFSLRA